MSTLTSPTGGPVANPILIPGGVTASNSDGTYLYLAGQQLQTSGPYKGLFAGNLTTINLTTYAVSAPVSISDGTHTKLLFADNDTMWIAPRTAPMAYAPQRLPRSWPRRASPTRPATTTA